MDIRELGRFDLNLLVAFQAILEERSVSRAAERLFITQSAMSKTLGRLRELFDDPLFTRTASGMHPTPRAEQIAAFLPGVLHGVEKIVQPMLFDPLSYQGEFSLSIPEYVAAWALPLLFKRLTASAPGMRVNTITHDDQYLDMLAAGELDFVVQIEHQSYPVGFNVATLGFAPPRLFARKGHPLEGKATTWEDIYHYPQIRLYVADSKDSRLAAQSETFIKHQLEAVPHLATEHLFTALQVVRATDHICAGPPLFLGQEDLSDELIALKIPDEEDLMLKFVIVHHERIAQSAAHVFMFEQFMSAVEQYRFINGLPGFEEMRRIRNLDY